MFRTSSVDSVPPGARPPAEYAPHPAAMSADTWPMSLDDMTQQLRASRRRHSSMVGPSPYDDMFKAAAGASALVNGRDRPGPTATPQAPISVAQAMAARKASLPVQPSPPMVGPTLPPRQFSADWEKRVSRAPAPAPLILGPTVATTPPAISESPTLPTVVLHPPEDESTDPIPLYPRPSPERAFFAPTGPARRIIDSAPIPPPIRTGSPPIPPPPAEAVNPDAPPFGRDAANASQVVMPKRADEVKRAEGFDQEFSTLMKEMESPVQSKQMQQQQQQQQPGKGPALYSQRRAPGPPEGSSAGPAASPLEQVRRATPKNNSATNKQGSSDKASKASSREAPTGQPAGPSKPNGHSKQASDPNNGAAPTTKQNRRRSLSLSAIFSRKKKGAAGGDVPPVPTDVPPVPPLPQMPASASAPGSTPSSRPETPSSDKKAKRRTLLGKGSLKDLFSKSQSQSQDDTDTASQGKMRRSQSKPELRKGRVTPADAPPMPPMPPRAQTPVVPTVVPDALAALTARSSQSPTSSPVEFVPDVFAAFGSTSGTTLGAVEAARAAAPPPAPPMPAGPAPASAASAASPAVQMRQQYAQSSPSLAKPTVTAAAEKRTSKAPPAKDADSPEEKRDRRKSLSQRLSLSSLASAFKKKKPTDGDAPDVPSLPPGFERASPSPQPSGGRGASKSAPSTPKMGKKQMLDDVPPLPMPLPEPSKKERPRQQKAPPGARPPLPPQMLAQISQEQLLLQKSQQTPHATAYQQPGLPSPVAISPQPQPVQQPQQPAQEPAPAPSATRQPLQQTQIPQPQVRKGSAPVRPQVDTQFKAAPLNVVAIKPPTPTQPLNIQKRVPVPSANSMPSSAEKVEYMQTTPTTPEEPTVVIVAADTVGSGPVTTSIPARRTSLPAKAPAPVVQQGTETLHNKKPSITERNSEDLPGLAYLEGGESEDGHANLSLQSHATASTNMPSFSVSPNATPPSTVRDARVTPSPAPSSAAKSSETHVETDPPSPSPSMMSWAEVHTAQTARRSEFRSLNSTEVLTFNDSKEELNLAALQNIVTRGENKGIAAAAAALTGGAGLGITSTGTNAPAKDDGAAKVAEPSAAGRTSEDSVETLAATSVVPLSAVTPAAQSAPPALVDKPEEMDAMPEGWTRVDPPTVRKASGTSRVSVKAASEDWHDVGNTMPPVNSSAPASLSRGTSPIPRPTPKRAPTVTEAIASTTIGLQPPPPSTLEEVVDEGRQVLNNASSLIASATNRMSYIASGLASVVTGRISSSNAEELAATATSSDSTPRSPPAELPDQIGHCYASPSAASTATFDTARTYESADEGSLDSATFETFETYSTTPARTYTPTMPPPQSSVPDLHAAVAPSRVRRGSMPVSLAATAARRRTSSIPVGASAALSGDDDDDHMPLRFESSAPIRRPYTGRNSSNATLASPTTPTQASVSPTVGLLANASEERADEFEVLLPGQPSHSRPDSPLDLQMPGMFNPIETTPFVVPFPPEGEESVPSSPRSPTAVVDYTPTAAARERTRRDSVISSTVGGLGFARQGPIDTVGGVAVVQTPTRSTAAVHEPTIRHSLPTVVDYSRSARSSRGSLGAEYAMWSDVSTPSVDTVPESGEPDAEPEVEESFQLDSSSCHSSSASDELDSAPFTPRTPELDTLTGNSPPSSGSARERAAAAAGTAASSAHSTPSKTTPGRVTGAPFRAMHCDMSRSTDSATESEFATANNSVNSVSM